MKVSFAITVHNEGEILERLLSQLSEFIEENDTDDEIVILDDYSDDTETIRILESYSDRSYVKFHQRELNRDFGAQKTHLNSLCEGDYIFQIDADEYLADTLLENLHQILYYNPGVHLFFIPRVNTVEGLTQEYIDMWGWNVNEEGWVMWPDWQTRLYKNSPDIIWRGAVHERIDGYVSYTYFPKDKDFAILHPKKIERQIKQNQMYSEIQKEMMRYE